MTSLTIRDIDAHTIACLRAKWEATRNANDYGDYGIKVMNPWDA